MNKKEIFKYNDGDRFKIIDVKDFFKDDRWYSSKEFLMIVGEATEGDNIVWEKTGKDEGITYVLNPELVKKVKGAKRKDNELNEDDQLKEIMKIIKENTPVVEGDVIRVRCVTPVKSHGRCGTRSHLKKFWDDIGATEDDCLVLYCVDNEKYGRGCGWRILKDEDIPKMGFTEAENELATST